MSQQYELTTARLKTLSIPGIIISHLEQGKGTPQMQEEQGESKGDKTTFFNVLKLIFQITPA